MEWPEKKQEVLHEPYLDVNRESFCFACFVFCVSPVLCCICFVLYDTHALTCVVVIEAQVDFVLWFECFSIVLRWRFVFWFAFRAS